MRSNSLQPRETDPLSRSIESPRAAFQTNITVQPADPWSRWSPPNTRLASPTHAIDQDREAAFMFDKVNLQVGYEDHMNQEDEGPMSSKPMLRPSNISRSSSINSLQSLVDSIFSIASISSISTVPSTGNAFQRCLVILKSDVILKVLYEELTTKTSPEKFKRNLGILLKRFSLDLEKEAACWNEQRTA
jgi:hypothetical protein